jgi:hypothetical protein
MSESDRKYEYPDYGPECCVEGCDHNVPGLKHGYEPSTREGVACNDCWEYLDDHGHWPDESASEQSRDTETNHSGGEQ